MGRLIDADELIKDDEVNLWLSNDSVRTGKTLKMFSELFIKKINEQPTAEAIPKDQYEARLKADMVAMLTDIQLEIEEMKMQSHTEKEIWNNAIGVCSNFMQQKIDSLEQEPKTGHWIEATNEYYVDIVYCSECKNKAPYVVVPGIDHYGRDISVKFKKTNYCPTCGIKMQESEETE